MNAEVNIVLYWPGNNRLATRTNTPRGNVVKIDTCFFTLFYLYKTEIQCLKFSIFRHIVCSPISESFSKFFKIGFWQLKKIQMLWIPNFIMNNDQVTHEKLTNTIYNLKQMIYMHTFVIKIAMAYLKLNRILIFDHFKDMYLYFRLKDI